MANKFNIGDWVVLKNTEFNPVPYVYRITNVSKSGTLNCYEIIKYEYYEHGNKIVSGYIGPCLEEDLIEVRKPSWWDESAVK